MFQIISNPFAEMAQGVAEDGLGYIATQSISYVAEKSGRSWSWVWWLFIPLSIIVAVGCYSFIKNKKVKEAKKKLEEEKNKALE